MGIRERRQREMAQREQTFLRVAREIIREEGLLNLQIARVAERSEYAVGTVYLHFASKEDLLVALTTQAILEHVNLFRRVGEWPASTRDRMFAFAVADMIFVRRTPEYFSLAQFSLCEVVWRAASPARREALLAAKKPIGEMVVDLIHQAVAAGDLELRGQSAEDLATGLWSLVVGFHNLAHTDGMLDDFNVREPYVAMCRHVQHLLNGFGWKPLADPGDRRALDLLMDRVCREVFGECAEAPRRAARSSSIRTVRPALAAAR